MTDRLIWALRQAILKDFLPMAGVPITAAEFVDIAPNILIRQNPEQALTEINELKLMGYLTPLAGWDGKYLTISATGIRQCKPEYPKERFIYGPMAEV